MEKNKKLIDKIYIIMIGISFMIVIATGTYAYYRTTISGTTSATIARWNFKANNSASTLALDFDLLYPGKKGTYNIELSAESSELDVYYELIFHSEYPFLITDNLYFDSSYTKGPNESGNRYVGMFGKIAAGEKITIPLYYNWSYEGDDYEQSADGTLISSDITIVAQQLTAYTGSIPMNLLGLDLVTYNNTNNGIKLIDCLSDSFGYGCGYIGDVTGNYRFELKDTNSGYIIVE